MYGWYILYSLKVQCKQDLTEKTEDQYLKGVLHFYKNKDTHVETVLKMEVKTTLTYMWFERIESLPVLMRFLICDSVEIPQIV